jgi:alpha-acetolactate decarboxylase
MFQTSMLSSLSEVDFDGDLRYKNLILHDDFGLGTFDDLDFITSDGKNGEHLLACEIENVKVEIDYTQTLFVQ